jgi:hypothetical protein
MDDIIKIIESQKNGDKFHDFVIDDAIYFIKKAKETLEDGLQDPEKWYENERVNSATFFKLFPYIYYTQQHLMNTPSQNQ